MNKIGLNISNKPSLRKGLEWGDGVGMSRKPLVLLAWFEFLVISLYFCIVYIFQTNECNYEYFFFFKERKEVEKGTLGRGVSNSPFLLVQW